MSEIRYDEHLCTQCGRPVEQHRSRCECCEQFWFPPLCCVGCDCGSHEGAHASLNAVKIA